MLDADRASSELFYSIRPWFFFAAASTFSFCVLQQIVSYKVFVADFFHDTSLLASVNSLFAFHSISKINVLMGQNKSIIEDFAKFCTACEVLAIHLKRSGPDFPLLLQSLIKILEQANNSSSKPPEAADLPIALNANLVRKFERVRGKGLPAFRSCMSVFLDSLEGLEAPLAGLATRELQTLSLLDASIATSAQYSVPKLYERAQTLVFGVFFTLEAFVNQVPKNGWFSLFTVPLLVTAYTALPRLAARFKNPFDHPSRTASIARTSLDNIDVIFGLDKSDPHLRLVCRR